MKQTPPPFLVGLLEGAAIIIGLMGLSFAISLTFFTVVVIGNNNQIHITK